METKTSEDVEIQVREVEAPDLETGGLVSETLK